MRQKRTTSQIAMDRINARTMTHSEWSAWKRYWSLLMSEGPTERTKSAERNLRIIMFAVMMRQSVEPAMRRYADALAAAVPRMRALFAAMNSPEQSS